MEKKKLSTKYDNSCFVSRVLLHSTWRLLKRSLWHSNLEISYLSQKPFHFTHKARNMRWVGITRCKEYECRLSKLPPQSPHSRHSNFHDEEAKRQLKEWYHLIFIRRSWFLDVSLFLLCVPPSKTRRKRWELLEYVNSQHNRLKLTLKWSDRLPYKDTFTRSRQNDDDNVSRYNGDDF